MGISCSREAAHEAALPERGLWFEARCSSAAAASKGVRKSRQSAVSEVRLFTCSVAIGGSDAQGTMKLMRVHS